MLFFSFADVGCREAVIYRVVVECRVEVSLNKETKFTLPYSLSRSLSRCASWRVFIAHDVG